MSIILYFWVIKLKDLYVWYIFPTKGKLFRVLSMSAITCNSKMDFFRGVWKYVFCEGGKQSSIYFNALFFINQKFTFSCMCNHPSAVEQGTCYDPHNPSNKFVAPICPSYFTKQQCEVRYVKYVISFWLSAYVTLGIWPMFQTVVKVERFN